MTTATHIFFDESLHRRGDFVLGAFVVADGDLDRRLRTAIRSVELTPGVDEYKSRHPHGSDPRYANLREELYRIVSGCQMGLMVAPYDKRSALGEEAMRALAYLDRENQFVRPVTAYFDEGLFSPEIEAFSYARQASLSADLELRVECDSRITLGIQLADLVAHTCSVMLLGQMGIVTKTVKAGANSGYDEDDDLPLEFELWARLRWNLLSRNLTDPELQEAASAGLVDTTCGLYVATTCSSDLAEAASVRFGQTWLGCIH